MTTGTPPDATLSAGLRSSPPPSRILPRRCLLLSLAPVASLSRGLADHFAQTNDDIGAIQHGLPGSQLSATASMSAAVVLQFHGLRGYASPRSAVAMPSVRVGRKRSQGIRCDYIGSATNLVRIYVVLVRAYGRRSEQVVKFDDDRSVDQ